MSDENKSPFHSVAGGGATNRDFWPNQMPVELLNRHSEKSNPLGGKFNYASLNFAP